MSFLVRSALNVAAFLFLGGLALGLVMTVAFSVGGAAP